MAFAAAVAACGSSPAARVVQTNWNSEHGLPSNIVRAVTQTPDGYLWLGTKRGLVRFDGLAFTAFPRGKNSARTDRAVSTLLCSREGVLWIGMEQDGLMRYRNGAVEPVIGQDGGIAARIYALAETQDGSIWIGSEEGLVHWRNGEVSVYSEAHGLPDNRVTALHADLEGSLWIGTAAEGVARFRNGAIRRVAVRNASRVGQARAIHRDRRGRFWVAGEDGVAEFVLAGNGALVWRALHRMSNARVLHEDREGALWVGTWGRVTRIKDGVLTSHALDGGHSDNQVNCLYQDRENSLWVGTRHYGLFRLRAGRFGAYTREDGLANDSVKAVFEDRTGAVWLGTDAGLNRLINGRMLGFPAGHELSEANVRTLAEGANGDIWIGTDRSLLRWREGRASAILDERGDMLTGVSALCYTRDGTLWIGLRIGLWRYRNGRCTRFTDGVSGDYVRDLMQARDGALWIATSRRGLKRLKNEQLTRWTVTEGLSSNDLYSLHEDAEGAVWIGTGEEGLCRWKAGKISRYSLADGLFDDSVYRILEDDRQNLWISGRKGIYRLSRRQLDDFADGKVKRISYVPYGRSDGMPSAECRGGHQPAGWKTRDGRLWFATTRGAVVIDPSQPESSPYRPKAIIEQVQLNGKAVNPFEPARVAAGSGRVALQYTAPSFADPRKIRFRYRLRGLETEWVDAASRRVADYTNLPPGKYEFEVIAGDKDSGWDSPAAVYQFDLLPAFYQTYWFYFTCVAALVLLAATAHRYRMLRLKSRFSAVLAERLRIAREIHDTILQGLTGISAHLEAITALLPESPAAAREALERTRVLARAAVEESRRSILNLRSRPLETGSLINALKDSARDLTAETPVRFQLQVGGEYRPLSESVERNLLRIAQEAMSNAVRHAQARQLTVELSFQDDAVRLAVADDGRGFAAAQTAAANHFGLVGIRERANEIGAKLEMNSAAGCGTLISVTVPLANGGRT